MNRDRRTMRLDVICEDKRTETFMRRLLARLGFALHRLTYLTKPKLASGAGEAWVRHRYIERVRLCRSKVVYQHVGVIAVVDGDRFGLDGRLSTLDEALRQATLAPRTPAEPIAVLVPSWSIETWLLALLGEPVDEAEARKHEFEKRLRARRERELIREAAEAWESRPVALPALHAARAELERLGR